MIDWVDEVLQGEPVYNILGSRDVNGVHFRLANEILREGTAFSAENMARIVQRQQATGYFYYNGEDTVTTDFPAAADGTTQGIFLMKAYAGMELATEGTVYIVADGSTQKVENPARWRVVRDCGVYCRVGDVVTGMVM